MWEIDGQIVILKHMGPPVHRALIMNLNLGYMRAQLPQMEHPNPANHDRPSFPHTLSQYWQAWCQLLPNRTLLS